MANFGAGGWIAMYLTMAQEVSSTHISTAIGLLSGCGSLAGALAMWGVGRITRQTGSFSIPMASVALAAVLSAFAGWIATKDTGSTESVSAGAGCRIIWRGQWTCTFIALRISIAGALTIWNWRAQQKMPAWEPS